MQKQPINPSTKLSLDTNNPCAKSGLKCGVPDCKSLRHLEVDYGYEELNKLVDVMGVGNNSPTNRNFMTNTIGPLITNIVLPTLTKMPFSLKSGCPSASMDCIDACDTMSGHVDSVRFTTNCIQGLGCELGVVASGIVTTPFQFRAFPKVGNKQTFILYVPIRFSLNAEVRIHWSGAICGGTQHTAVQIRVCSMLMILVDSESNFMKKLDILDMPILKFDTHITDDCSRHIQKMAGFFSKSARNMVKNSVLKGITNLVPSLNDAVKQFQWPLPIPDLDPTFGIDANGKKFFVVPFMGFTAETNPVSGVVYQSDTGKQCAFMICRPPHNTEVCMATCVASGLSLPGFNFYSKGKVSTSDSDELIYSAGPTLKFGGNAVAVWTFDPSDTGFLGFSAWMLNVSGDSQYDLLNIRKYNQGGLIYNPKTVLGIPYEDTAHFVAE